MSTPPRGGKESGTLSQIMETRSLVRLALGGETLLVVVAVLWGRWRGLPLRLGDLTSSVSAGLVTALALAAVNGFVICGAPDITPVRSMRRLYATGLKPMFERLSFIQMVVISTAAGWGEELLFRGVLMPEIGLVGSSLVFGILHMGGPGTLAFGAWVAVMGGALGGVTQWTGGLLAPIIAHAVYDALALCYIRWGRECDAVADLASFPPGQDRL